MKQFLITTFLSLLTLVAFGQNPAYLRSDYNKGVVDTVQTGFLTKTQTSTTYTGYYPLVGVNVVVTKISGTPAGTIRLFGSIDGVNYTRVNATDSLVVTNVATSFRTFSITSWPYAYLRVQAIGTGTMAAKLQTRVIFKK